MMRFSVLKHVRSVALASGVRRKAIIHPSRRASHLSSLCGGLGSHHALHSEAWRRLTTSADIPPIETVSLQDSWEGLKARLINLPCGSFTSKDWNEAEEALNNTQNENPASVTSAFALLDRLNEDAKHCNSGYDEGSRIGSNPLTRTLVAWRSCAEKDASSLPLSSDEVMERLKHYADSGLVKPTVKEYNMVINVIQLTKYPSQAPLLAETVLEKMIGNGSDSTIRPNHLTHSKIIELWSKSGLEEAADRAEAHFARLKKLYKETGDPDLQPDAHIYANVITTWKNSNHPQAVHRSVELLNEIGTATNIKPNYVVYSTVLDALSKSGKARQAHDLLNEMLRLSEDDNALVSPDVISFSSVMTAYIRAGQPEMVEELFYRLVDLYERTGDEQACPNYQTYSVLIDSYAKSGQPQKAEAVFQRMLESLDENTEPNVVSFTSVLDAWAKSKDPRAADRVSHLVQRMDQLYKEGKSKLKPNRHCYNVLLDCFAKSNNPKRCAPAAQKLLETLRDQKDPDLKPNVVMYSAVIDCWAASGDPVEAERIESLLKEMEHLHQSEGLDTNPNTISYTSYLKCLSRWNEPNAPEKAEAVLRHMQQQWEAGDRSVKPSAIAYNTCIAAWSRSKRRDAPERAKVLFQEMEASEDGAVRPNSYTYTTLMAAFSRHSRPLEVQAIFDDAKQQYKRAGDEALRPHFPMYRTMLNAWCRAGEPEAAACIMEEMILEYQGGHLPEPPDVRIFSMVLKAWSRSSHPNAAEKAEQGLEQMHALHASGRFNVRPNRITYSTVIAAHLRSRQPDGIVRAYNLLQRLTALFAETKDEDCRPNLIVYSMLICALSRRHGLKTSNMIGVLLSEMEKNVSNTAGKSRGLKYVNKCSKHYQKVVTRGVSNTDNNLLESCSITENSLVRPWQTDGKAISEESTDIVSEGT